MSSLREPDNPAVLDAERARLDALLPTIVSNDAFHARWLNSLALLENSGARKISAAQHSVHVDETILQHSVEEARHAWYLKRQIRKVYPDGLRDFSPEFLLAPAETRHYLHKLDVGICRLLKQKLGSRGEGLRSQAYRLVTYAIEVQADRLYGSYEAVLSQAESDVSVRNIISEEEGHLEVMAVDIAEMFDDPAWWIDRCHEIESSIFDGWISAVERNVHP